jgi:O-antigen biosynthesis protein
MQVALLSPCGPARNAIGRQLAAKAAFFVERGACLRVFLESTAGLHPELTPYAHCVAEAKADGPHWDFLRRCDLVIADYPQTYELLHLLPLLVGRRPRRILDYHGVTPAEFWHGPQRGLLEKSACERGIVWCADFALTHSKFALEELHRATGYPRQRMVVLPYPTDTELFQPRERPAGCHRRAYAGASLLYVGRIAPSKGLGVLVEALTHLPDAHLVIVGDDRDVYGVEAARCRELADRLGVAARLRFLGQLSDEALAEEYRKADVLVIPSRHEGYCLPVIEAMASGLPVVAARTSALPETVGAAGLTFKPDDAADLAGQVRRVVGGQGDAERPSVSPLPRPATTVSLRESWRGRGGRVTTLIDQSGAAPLLTRNAAAPGLNQPRRVAVVSFRFGGDIVGGAERSLNIIATALQRGGQHVEVFTTCTRRESDWRNDLPAGTTSEDGLTIHRFPVDPHDKARHDEALRKIGEARLPLTSNPSPQGGEGNEYLRHSIHSTALLDELQRRGDDFDAIIVGPYLFGLTHDIAAALPDKTLLLPCFHDEPLSRLGAWIETYTQVAGVLYHSPEEQDYAQCVLGLNHPRAVLVGTWLDLPSRGMSEANPAGQPPRDLVYCGRYSAQKNLPLLLDFAERYERQHPRRYRFSFIGQGEVKIPATPWTRDLGRLGEEEKHAALVSAAALVQLSTQESLSLVALEAWAAGTPVIVQEACAVLRGQVQRSGGGMCVAGYEQFAAALDDLWQRPDVWRQRGRQGRSYVERHYLNEEVFRGRLLCAIDNMRRPLAEAMRQHGLRRAAERSVSCWRHTFADVIENLLDREPPPATWDIAVQPRTPHVRVAAGKRTALVPVRLLNRGTLPALAHGPAQASVVGHVYSVPEARAPSGTLPTCPTPLARNLQPGQTHTAMISLSVPAQPGDYQVALTVVGDAFPQNRAHPAMLPLTVGTSASATDSLSTAPLLDAAQEALAQAYRLQRLPDDYLDVTEGRFARLKRWLKRKLLGNFKKGYVDVLSRQQSEVNGQLIAAVQELSQSCAALDHLVRQLQGRIDMLERNSTHPESACRLAGRQTVVGEPAE